MRKPAGSAQICELAPGIAAVAPGLAWLPQAKTLVAADAHLAYEDVVGGALPLWSTTEIVTTLGRVSGELGAREIVFLGDVVHGATMSEGAMQTVRAALERLRTRLRVTLVAGNHEGRTRAFAVLGETLEACERDGWLLVHGDRPAVLGRRAVIGHLHPSLHVGGRATIPAFVACDALVVVPALTPYSRGLDLCSDDFAGALAAWAVARRDVHVVAATTDRIFPFGALSALRRELRPAPPLRRRSAFRRPSIRPDR